jgi:hypothetical protein
MELNINNITNTFVSRFPQKYPVISYYICNKLGEQCNLDQPFTTVPSCSDLMKELNLYLTEPDDNLRYNYNELVQRLLNKIMAKPLECFYITGWQPITDSTIILIIKWMYNIMDELATSTIDILRGKSYFVSPNDKCNNTCELSLQQKFIVSDLSKYFNSNDFYLDSKVKAQIEALMCYQRCSYL